MCTPLRVIVYTLYFVLLGPRLLWAADPPFALPSPEDLTKLRSALISTDRGDLYFELFPDSAPWHVANFKYLADKGFYRGLRFHLLYPNYILQGGAPGPKPDSGPGYTLPAEFNEHKHQTGALGMARLPNFLNSQRRSNGSQFHILLGTAAHMDGDYTVFGQLVKGFEVLEQLGKGDQIREVKVFVRTGGQ